MAELAARLSQLKIERSSAKGAITRIKTFVETKHASLTETELDCRLGILESYFRQLLTSQTAIEKLAPDPETDEKTREEYENLYCTTKAHILTLLNGKRVVPISPSATAEKQPTVLVYSAPANSLPKISLPQFSGKYSEYPKFIATFSTLVDQAEKLSKIEKFNHLINCLHGAALRTIQGLEVTGENYSIALSLLKERYDKKTLIFQEHISELFDLPKVPKHAPNQLRSVIDSAKGHLQALRAVSTDGNLVEALLIHLISSKIDSDSLSKWEEKIDYAKYPTWSEFTKVLERRCEYLEARDSKSGNAEPGSNTRTNNNKAQPAKQNSSRSRSSGAVALTVSHNLCVYCEKSGHLVNACQQFKELSVLDRFDTAKRLMVCINCLSKGHSVRKCSSSKCRVCGGPHHTLLHRYNQSSPRESVKPIENSTNSSAPPVNSIAPKPSTSKDNPSTTANVVGASLKSSITQAKLNPVCLATAIIEIQDSSGQYQYARALLDSASQTNFLTESMAQQLRLKKNRINSNISGIGDVNTAVQFKTHAVVKSRNSDFKSTLDFWILPSITELQPQTGLNVKDWDLPHNVELADPLFYKPQRVDVLIGAGIFFELLSVGQIKLGEGCPILQKTLLGWIVSGSYARPTNKFSTLCNFVDDSDQDAPLEKIVEKFWQIDAIESKNVRLNAEQENCERTFLDTVTRLTNGRFMVKLPFKESPHKLGNSRDTAFRRFLSLERRLSKDPSLKVQYSAFLKDYELSNHMELVAEETVPSVHYFLPHQCVLRPLSSTTKLRVVFDASCRTSSQLSLNDILMVGPTVQDDLSSIILRFRGHRFALTADISAMYRQILVQPEDQHFQYILWRDNPEEKIRVFKLKTVTYGTASAPYLATRCLNYLAELHQESHPTASNVIRHDFYVDDLITGADTHDEICKVQRDVDDILRSAQFSLRKWYSNDNRFLLQIPETERESPLRINDLDVIKTLGIIWEPTEDSFHFVYTAPSSRRITKRAVLSELARLFDPLGWISPIVVRAKIFFQELWLLNLHWDESLPVELESRWQSYREEMQLLNKIRIPRFVLCHGDIAGIEIHGFSDASTRAYGCCIYVRSQDSRGNIAINLLSAKSRVAPNKSVKSLPCLELCAAVLLVELLEKVKANFAKPYEQIFLWTDSEVVLDWLSAHPSTWKTFVANRVSRIQELSSAARWRYVNSKANPADIVSRGSSIPDLGKSIWLKGPEFLRQPEENWPTSRKHRIVVEELPERRKPVAAFACTISQQFIDVVISCSNFKRNCRRFALVLRFWDNLAKSRAKKDIARGDISAQEFDNAFLRIVHAIQQKEFASEIGNLQNNKLVSSKSLIKALNPFVDNSRGFILLRVGGRLKQADLPYNVTCPILLPKNNIFVASYFEYLHTQNFHAGPQATINLSRQRFWILNARQYARRVVKRCLHCFRYRPKIEQQIMGDLPKDRIVASMPFEISGVDFCGPIQTTHRIRGRTPQKSYIAVFVCFVTRAVHMEVVSDLTTEAFIAALKRFVGRRSLCRRLYCDNATNFVGARRQLSELRQAFLSQQTQSAIGNWCLDSSIEFKHIPPRTPHFGGIWEAAVKSAKTLLVKTLQTSLLTFEELSTVVVQIEAILNSRPITPLSSDPNDEQALTPAHFLNQAPTATIVEPAVALEKMSNLRRWQRISAMQQHFWTRWSQEYILLLQQRHKWQKSSSNVKIGTLVLISEDNVPPQRWLLGRIIAAIPGPDNQVRVVDIKTKQGVIRRSIHRIAPLPIDDQD